SGRIGAPARPPGRMGAPAGPAGCTGPATGPPGAAAATGAPATAAASDRPTAQMTPAGNVRILDISNSFRSDRLSYKVDNHTVSPARPHCQPKLSNMAQHAASCQVSQRAQPGAVT